MGIVKAIGMSRPFSNCFWHNGSHFYGSDIQILNCVPKLNHLQTALLLTIQKLDLSLSLSLSLSLFLSLSLSFSLKDKIVSVKLTNLTQKVESEIEEQERKRKWWKKCWVIVVQYFGVSHISAAQSHRIPEQFKRLPLTFICRYTSWVFGS